MRPNFSFLFRVEGDFALFTDPAFKGERVSYPVLTPSAAVGIIEQVYWKPEMRYIVEKIFVEKKIQMMPLARSETNKPTQLSGIDISVDDNRVMRTSSILRDVSYVVQAHVEGTKDNSFAERTKHLEIVKRRLQGGQSYGNPYLGCREMPARLTWVDSVEDVRCVPITRKIGRLFAGRTWIPNPNGSHIGLGIADHHFIEAELVHGVLNVEAA